VLIKRTERQTRRSGLVAAIGNQSGGGFDRRSFLRKSGLVAGGLATIGALPLASVRKAEAAGPNVAGATIRKNICTHCSVGCTVTAEVSNGVWVGQEPSWDSPINRGSHCAKGAATRETVHSDRRLRYPMKLVNGQWTRDVYKRQDLTGGHSGLVALAEAMRRWIVHVLGVEVTIEPLTELRDAPLSWYVGLDADATRIGDRLWNEADIDEAAMAGVIGLFALTFRDPSIMLDKVKGEPVYLIPVSYTHLDVYKRQGFDCRDARAAKAETGQDRLRQRDGLGEAGHIVARFGANEKAHRRRTVSQ